MTRNGRWPPAHLCADEQGEMSPECWLLPHPPPLAAHQHHALQVAVAQVAQDLHLQLLGQRQDVAAPAPAPSVNTHFWWRQFYVFVELKYRLLLFQTSLQQQSPNIIYRKRSQAILSTGKL